MAELTLRQNRQEIFALLALGLSDNEVAQRLDITRQAVWKARSDLAKSLPVKEQRRNLGELLPRTVEVLEAALDGHKDGIGARKIATDVSIALNRGLGVLVDRQETETTTRTETVETKRVEAVLQIQASRQFGIAIPAEYEILEDKPDKSALTQAQDSTPTDQAGQ